MLLAPQPATFLLFIWGLKDEKKSDFGKTSSQSIGGTSLWSGRKFFTSLIKNPSQTGLKEPIVHLVVAMITN